MSNAPLDRLLFGDLTPDYIRELNHEYHVETIAENSKQVVDYHKASLRLQGQSAALNLRVQAELAQRQDETNRHLSDIAQGVGSMVRGLDNLSDRVDAGFGAVEETLERISQQLMEQQRTLETIAELLRRPYEAKALELRREADKWLTSGMRNTGRDREEDWKDARRLLDATVDNPVGMQDYVAWFQLGWLKWKHDGNVAQAEESFYRAGRLSANNRDLYHVKSLRHLSYMQYLQTNYQDAYATIQKALNVSCDHDTMYDAARYSSKIGREKEAIDFLDKCIELRPTTIITMYSEVDFQ